MKPVSLRDVILGIVLFAAATLHGRIASAADCNGDGRADDDEISRGLSPDCNGNGIPDGCDLSGVRFAPITYIPVPAGARIARAADLDRDGDMDLAVANGGTVVSVMLNAGGGLFGAPVEYALRDGVVAMALADLDGDGAPEIIAGSTGSAGLNILPNRGDGTFGARVDYNTERTRAVLPADLDGDRDTDLVIMTWNYGYERSKIRVWLNDGHGGFTAITHQVGNGLNDITLGDFDHDGDLDIMAANGKTTCTCLYLLANNGLGAFGTPAERALDHLANHLAGVDLDADHDADLVLMKNYTFATMYSNGDSSLMAGVDWPQDWLPYGFVGADLDGDGDTDVVSVSHREKLPYFLNRGDGTLQRPLYFVIVSGTQGREPLSLAVADFDGDRRPDVATANSGSSDVALLLNRSIAPVSRDENFNGVPDECECPRGCDWDNDLDVDMDDCRSFVSCASGPSVPFAVGCESRDLDCDGDVDQDDFGRFQRCFSGSGRPAGGGCAG